MARIMNKDRWRFGLVAFLYIVFLIVPWVLTCLQARRPFSLTSYFTRRFDVGVGGIRQRDADVATQFSYTLDVFNYLSPLIALPVIYEILARAAVIYTLRTRSDKQLSARQLFSLADRKFIWGVFYQSSRTPFSCFAVLLILLSVAHIIVRGSTLDVTWTQHPMSATSSSYWFSNDGPNGWHVEQIALSPTPEGIRTLPLLNALTKLKQDIIGSHPLEWQRKAWLAPREGPKFFATSVPKGTTTGLLQNLALRLDSDFECTGGVLEDDYPTNCPGGEEYPYWHPMLRLNICVQGNGTGIVDGQHVSPWANTTDKQRIDESIWVSMPDYEIFPEKWREWNMSVSVHNLWDWKGDFRCTARTDLAYFELENDINNKTRFDKIHHLSEAEAAAARPAFALNYYPSGSAAGSLARDRPDALDEQGGGYWGSPVPGPLTLAARALFGNGSFYDLSQRISPNNTARDDFSAMLAASCPYPFQRHPLVRFQCIRDSSEYYDSEYDDSEFDDMDFERWAGRGVVKFVTLLNAHDKPYRAGDDGPGWALLNSALHLANQAVMDSSIMDLPDYTDDWRSSRELVTNGIFKTKGIYIRQFVISDVAIWACSVLLGLQILGILALVVYTYRLPTWTSTLDALAVARIAQQLKDGHLLRAIGLRRMTTKEKETLTEIDGLIGLVEPIPLEDMSSTAASSTSSSSQRHGSGPSSITQADAHSQHSPVAAVAPVVRDDPRMGMSSIPIDVQTVISEELDNNNNTNQNTNLTTNRDTLDVNANTQAHTRTSSVDRPLPLTPLEGRPLPPTPLEPSAPRRSLNVPDMMPEYDHDDEPGGTSSPPAYTPRTRQPEQALEPPSYAAASGVGELRVGGQGIVNRKNIQRVRDDLV